MDSEFKEAFVTWEQDCVMEQIKYMAAALLQHEHRSVSPCMCVTVGLLRRAAAAESHDDGSKSKASLHAVLPDAFQDVARKVDVQITQEYNAVTVL